MDIVDVRAINDAAKSLQRDKYATACDLADSHFGASRVSAEGRGFVSGSPSRDIYIDMERESLHLKSNIEICVGKINAPLMFTTKHIILKHLILEYCAKINLKKK